MTFDLFNQLLYIRSMHNNEADFLKKLEHMTPEEVRLCYAKLLQKKHPNSKSEKPPLQFISKYTGDLTNLYNKPANNLINICPNRKYALRPVRYLSVTSQHSSIVFIKSFLISVTA